MMRWTEDLSNMPYDEQLARRVRPFMALQAVGPPQIKAKATNASSPAHCWSTFRMWSILVPRREIAFFAAESFRPQLRIDGKR